MFKTANAEWCKPVLVLDPAEFPLDAREGGGHTERLLLAWTGLRCRHGRATEVWLTRGHDCDLDLGEG
jgi:hypothetical protein